MTGWQPGATISVISRDGCHLCDDVEGVVARVAADLDVRWERVDVDADPELVERYGEEVPVTFVGGRQHDYWRIDEARLRAAVADLPSS
ncbi:glutaredoxin family protein [Marihabitans asiaticum]|nr:glutaredoxin family protein [Marihabitans asiaticum]